MSSISLSLLCSSLISPPLLSLPTLSGLLLLAALLTTLHPRPKQVATVSYSSQLLQVPPLPTARAISPVAGAPGWFSPLLTAGPCPPPQTGRRGRSEHLPCPGHLPRVGMLSLQGSASGVMACWYTKAERLPATQNRELGGTRGPDTFHPHASGPTTASQGAQREGKGGGLSWTIWGLTATNVGFLTPTPCSCFGDYYPSLTGREVRAGAGGWRAPGPTHSLQGPGPCFEGPFGNSSWVCQGCCGQRHCPYRNTAPRWLLSGAPLWQTTR